VADFCYLRCWEGLVFFCFVIDVYSRKVVGWQLATSMRTDLVLERAQLLGHPGGGVLQCPSRRGDSVMVGDLPQHPQSVQAQFHAGIVNV